MIQKLLTIDREQILSGLSMNNRFPSPGIFMREIAVGLNPFISGTFGEEGLLRQVDGGQDLRGGVVTQNSMAAVNRVAGSGDGKAYFLGSGGHFYSLDTDTIATPSNLRSATPITNPVNAIAIYQPQGGTEYAYYWQQDQIGRWDISGSYPTGWTDNHFTGLQSFAYHPKHPFAGDVFYGNKDRIGKIYDNAGTAANNTNVLDVPSNFRVLCLNDDGEHLIAGITTNLGDGELTAETKIIFWDTFSPSWQHEWPLPDNSINAIVKHRSGFYAITQDAIYDFSFYAEPKMVWFGRDEGLIYGNSTGATRFRDAVIYKPFADITALALYGEVLPGFGPAYFTPFPTGGSTQSLIHFITSTDMIASLNTNASDRFIRWNWEDGSLGSWSAYSLATVPLPLPQESRVLQIDIVFDDKLADLDGISTLGFTTTSGDLISFSTTSSSTDTSTARQSFFPQEDSLPTDTVALAMDLVGSNCLIRKIEFYGEPIATV